MPKFKKYYVVEYRLAISIEEADSVQKAVSMAKRICERQYGFIPENWNARIFEYGSGENKDGSVSEYFYNPNSSNFREITKNIGYHKDLIEKGIDPTKEVEDES
tara:strand:- start:2636 stop:2947 length:312 start_codon:yes stop_codon:yes gene_type:complete